MSDDVATTTAAVDAQRKRYDELAETLRGRVDTAAKAFGGLATAALTAAGIAKISDVFPLPPGPRAQLALVATVVGFAFMAIGVLWFTARLWKVNQPVFLRADARAMEADRDIDADERKEVEAVYERAARLNGLWTLGGYEARAFRLRRILARTEDPALAARLSAEVAEIEADIRMTLDRAKLRIIRRRANRAVRGKGAVVLYTVFVAGVLLFALGSDYLSSGRTEDVAIAKACADARTAGATGTSHVPKICGSDPRQADLADISLAKQCAGARTAGATGLPKACGAEPAPAATETVSPEEEAATAATALAESLDRCAAVVRSGKLPRTACDPIRRALATVAGP
jgi:hypothetical protein